MNIIQKKSPPSRKGCIPWNKGIQGIQVAWNKGIPMKEESRKKSSLSHKGHIISETTREKLRQRKGSQIYNYKGGLPHCLKCQIKLGRRNAKYCRTCAGKLRRGSNNYSWKGGITPLIRKIRNCIEYKIWRNQIFKRDKYQCILCKIKSGNGKAIILNADHYPKMFKEVFQENKIKSYEEAVCCQQLWDVKNGRTLCQECHKIETKKQWKK